MAYLTQKEKDMIRKWSGEEGLQEILKTPMRGPNGRENKFLQKIKGISL